MKRIVVAPLIVTALLAPGGSATAVRTPAEVNTLCVSVREQVVDWSRKHARSPGRAHVVAISGGRALIDRLTRSPSNGILLKCKGRAKLSNGLHSPAVFGIRAINDSWYLFLKPVKHT